MIRFKTLDSKTRKNDRSGCFAQVFITAAMLSAPGFALAAQPEDALNFAVGAGFRFEDNLFRLDDDANTPVPGKSRRSDLISTYSVGIKIDKSYSLQRFQVDLEAIRNDYHTYDYLDFTAKNYRAAWLWSLTPDLTGTILLTRNQQQNDFADFLTGATNEVIPDQSVQTNEVRSFTADWRVGGGWHLLGGVSEIRSRNEANFTAVGDYVQRGGEAGIKYVSRADNFISLVQRNSTGDYEGRALNPFSQLDTGFDQSETEAQLNYRLSGKSLIDARLGYVDREHDNFSSRDYDGMVGRLAYIWAPTGKLVITTSLSRSLTSFQQVFNSYYVSDTFAVAPVWNLTAKTKIRARYFYSERDYRGAIRSTISPFAYNGPLRDDKVQGLTLSAEWQAMRTLLITGTLQHERRDSNSDFAGTVNSLDYDANSIGISGQLLF